MPFSELNHTNLSKQVVKVIRRQILSGELKPDERVVESRIARALGISRAPLREALVELSREGLVVTYPRKGTYVKHFTEKDIKEIYTLRALLEGYAATLASKVVKQRDLERLQKLVDEMKSLDTADVTNLNMQFHEEICKLANHQRLHLSWKSLFAQTRMLSAMAAELERNVAEVRREHEVLLHALIGGDKAHIKQSFEKHILGSMNRFISHLQEAKAKKHQGERSLKRVRSGRGRIFVRFECK